MKKSLLLFIAGSVLLSCNESPAPKQVAQEFIQNIHADNFTAAAALVTPETRALVNQQKPKPSSTTTAEECFSLSTLTETVNNNTAQVKNENIVLSLKKEHDGWKVSADEKTINAIKNRESNLAAVKEAWKKLLQEYQTRLQVAKEYVDYKKASGPISENLKKLDAVINSSGTPPTGDKGKMLAYVGMQKQVEDLIDQALEPSYTASADLSMNYFFRLSNANDRIKNAEGNYQDLVKKTPSSTYPLLPFKATNSIRLSEN